jgi:hypothetical protein
MVIFSKVKLGVSPDINALASLIICLVGVCVLVAGYLMRRTERQRLLDAQWPSAERAARLAKPPRRSAVPGLAREDLAHQRLEGLERLRAIARIERALVPVGAKILAGLIPAVIAVLLAPSRSPPK